MKKRFRLWDNAQMAAYRKMDYGDTFLDKHLQEIIPEDMDFAAGGTELTDLLYIIYGTESLDTDIVEPGTYPDDVYQCKKALIHFFEKHSEKGAEEQIWSFLKFNREERKQMSDDAFIDIASSSLILPARVIVYLTSEIKKLDFWHLWRELEPSVYHDEQMKKYISEQLEAFRRETIEKPIPEISTCDFLRQDGSLTFYGTPEELKERPNYYITDDDRLYWWDGTDEVQISDSTDAWLKELAERHKRIQENLEEDTDTTHNFIEELIILMEDTEKYYIRIFLFQTMFYDFVHNSSRKEYRAAIELLRQLVEENKEDGKIIEKAFSGWDVASRNVTHNIARLKLKRYLSVLANKKLRKQYFEF
jgi:hypothetical protein